jgi:hypothetical protein
MSDDRVDLSGSDHAFERLRVADPAGHAQPDLVAIRAAVDSRINATPADELTARRTRSARPWLIGAAAAVAGAVLIGSGGFALGSLSASSDAAKVRASNGVSPTFSANDLATGQVVPNPTFDKSAPVVPGSINGGVTEALPSNSRILQRGAVAYTDGLPQGGMTPAPVATAAAFAYDAGSADPIAAGNGLLRAVGAKPNTTYNGTSATFVGGSAGKVLSVRANGLLGFSYSDSSLDVGNCAAATGSGAVQPMYGAGSGPIATMPGVCTPVTSSKAPSRSQALLTSRKVLAATGLNSDSYRWVVGAPTNGQVSVTAVAKVGGHELVNAPTGLDPNWQFTVVSGNRVSRASGALARVVPLGTYKVVSPAAGVARLNDSTYHAWTSLQGVPNVVPATGTSSTPNSAGSTTSLAPAASSDGRLPAAPSPGSKVAWPVTTVSIVKVGLTLAPYAQPNGAVVVMPTFVMTASDGSRYYVIAVDSRALAPTSR